MDQECSTVPITQDRVFDLLQAGQDYQQALHRAENEVAAAANRARRGSDPAAELMQLEALVSSPFLLTHPQNSASALAREAEKYKQSYRRNIKRRGAKGAANEPE
jgi:hypothetical protein